MYHRLRRSWGIHSGGPTGGIYKSTDCGRTWRKLTRGLPTGETGMIGIDIYRRDPRSVMPYVEASDELPTDMSLPGPGVYRSEDGGAHLDPQPIEGAEYRDGAGPCEALADHLRAIADTLGKATSPGGLNTVRAELMGFSALVGDTAFFGFFRDELRPTVARAGEYRVRLTVDGRTYTGSVTVRGDPLLTDAAQPVAAAGRVR